jgi:2',3'-cyclic-nucleotide 2'-phosphodiesterase (5'-nucleotidase family)
LAPWDAVGEYAATIPRGEMLVVLSHIGLSLDRILAERVPRIDIVLGGHSHDTLYRPEVVNGVPIVHAGPYGRYVSRTELSYDEALVRFTIRAFELVPLLGPA